MCNVCVCLRVYVYGHDAFKKLLRLVVIMDGYPATPETEWRGRASNYHVWQNIPTQPRSAQRYEFQHTKKDGNLANDLLLQRVYSYCSSKSALT